MNDIISKSGDSGDSYRGGDRDDNMSDDSYNSDKDMNEGRG